MNVTATAIADVKIITPRLFEDGRGYFCETWNRATFAAHGIDLAFVQDNLSLSRTPGTVRGLHFQRPPFAQAKLVSVLRGSALDIVVDIRHGSATFAQHVAVELSAANRRQLLVPAGFAHGFVTLEADTEVAYKVTAHYAPDHDLGVAWNDPDLDIDWRLPPGVAPVISDKDQALPRLRDVPAHFTWGEQGGTGA